MELVSLVWNLEIPTHCDGCGADFSKAHGLECKKGGLFIQRHDESKFELQDLAARTLITSLQLVRGEPQIYPGRRVDVEATIRFVRADHEESLVTPG